MSNNSDYDNTNGNNIEGFKQVNVPLLSEELFTPPTTSIRRGSTSKKFY